MTDWIPKITIEITLEETMKAIKAKSKMTKVAIQWAQSPSKDVIQYRLYVETGDKTPTYDSPYCTIAKPTGNRPTIKYKLSECHLFFGYSGIARIAVAAVDGLGNISDLTESIQLII